MMCVYCVALPVGVTDRLLANGNDNFRVEGSGGSELVITATGPRQFLTTQGDFIEFLKTITFVTNDQTGSSGHTVTLVVQEHPLATSPPSLPAIIQVVIIPVNDRPVIISTQQVQASLTDYIPESLNRGFYPSFLLNESNVEDVDSVVPAFVGLAITAVTGSGQWMVWINDTWVSLSSVSECTPQLVAPEARIRFVPSPDPRKADTQASLVYRAWDGTSLIQCVNNTPLFTDQSALSAENETFTFNIEYLNRAPTVVQDQYALPDIEEDGDQSVGVVIGTIAGTLGSDSDDLFLGLAVVGADSRNGVWQYRDVGYWNDFPTRISPEWVLLLSSSSQVRYVPNTDYFGPASFTALIWDMSDNSTNTSAIDPYTGTFSIDQVTINISVSSVNDVPVVVVGVPVVEYTEGGPAVQVFRNLTISDVDNTELVWAEVTVECPLCGTDSGSGDIGSGYSLVSGTTDVLITRHPPPNFLPTVQSSNSMKLVVRVTAVDGTDNSPAEFARYLESLYFTSTSKEPSETPRVASLIVSDGINVSDPVSVNITVLLINDEPPVVILPYTTVTWREDSGPLPLFTSPVVIQDPDFSTLHSATLHLLNYDPDFESLQLLDCDQFDLNCQFENGTLVLSGEHDIEIYEQALTQVEYNNSHLEPADHARVVAVIVSDGFFSSHTVELQIEVELVNDQLPVVTVGQTKVVFQEPDRNPITTRVRVAPDTTITDADSGNFLLHSATLTILDPLDGNMEGLILSLEGAPLINVTGQSQHALTLSSDGGVPLIILQDAIRAVEYSNSAEQMNNVNRTIEITVNDTLTSGVLQTSSPARVIVMYVTVDDLPEVRLMDNILPYAEGQTPPQLQLAVNANIIDVDSQLLSRLNIELNASSTIDTSQEALQVNLTGFESSISQQPTENSQLLIELVGEAAVEDYRSVLRTLTYQHLDTPGDPDPGLRTITVTPFSLSGERGVPDSVIVAFSGVNNAPVVDLNGPGPGLNDVVSYPEESTVPVALAGGARISDVDSPELANMSIVLMNALDGDMEYISIENGTLEVAYQTGSRIEVVGQPSPISEFEAVLQTLTYHNLADEPHTTTRVVSVYVNDGESTGSAVVEVFILPTNDAPELTLNAREVVYVEEGDVLIAETPQVFDPDSLIVGYRVRPERVVSGDTISGPFLSFDQGNNVYIAQFNGTSPQQAAEMLGEVTFTSSLQEPMTSDRVFCISVRDEDMAASHEVCVTVKVQVVNDNPPQFLESSYLARVNENQQNISVIQVEATDMDSINSNVTLYYAITAGDDCLVDYSGSGLGNEDTHNPLIPDEVMPDDVTPCRFQIDPLTGVVSTTSAAPDREERDSYTLTVTVTDGQLRSHLAPPASATGTVLSSG